VTEDMTFPVRVGPCLFGRCLRAGWLVLILALAACGGGGGDAGNGEGTPHEDAFGPAVSLRLSQEMPQRVSPGTTAALQVLAVNAAGVSRDVTAQVRWSVDAPQRLTATVSDSLLRLQFAFVRGKVTLHLEAIGVSMSQAIWITAVEPMRVVDRIEIAVTEGYGGIVPDADDSLPMLLGRDVRVTVSAIHDGGMTDITEEVDLASSNVSALPVQPVVAPTGEVPSWHGYTLGPGEVSISASWAQFEATRLVRIGAGLVLRAGWASEAELTENAAGRLTAYVHVGDDLGTQQLAYVESPRSNQWRQPVFLPTPSSEFHILASTMAAEAANGYRATVTTNSLSESWVYLIGPAGELKGPTIVSDGSNGNMALRIAVSSDGNAHVWLWADGAIVRKIVRFSDSGVGTVNAVPMPADLYTTPQLAVGSDGTVGLVWVDEACRVHYAFDNLARPAPFGLDAAGSATVTECDPSNFANIFTQYDTASGGDKLAIVIRYGTGFNATTTELLTISRGVAPSAIVLDRDGTAVAGRPRIGMSHTGELVASWATEERGIWAFHRAAALPELPFLVEPPFFSYGTPAMHGVHSRGDGRFVLVWHGGQHHDRTALELRDYAATTGLSERLSIPYQNGDATFDTTILASPNGISAVWSFWPDLHIGEFDAVQAIRP
jgi:hypothetical protein